MTKPNIEYAKFKEKINNLLYVDVEKDSRAPTWMKSNDGKIGVKIADSTLIKPGDNQMGIPDGLCEFYGISDKKILQEYKINVSHKNTKYNFKIGVYQDGPRLYIPSKVHKLLFNAEKEKLIGKKALVFERTGELEYNLIDISLDFDKSPMSDVYLDEKDCRTLINLLKYKQNVILRGPPGVGKTFVAKRLAKALMAEKGEDLSDVDSRIKMVQFNQNYSYEEFVRGYRPNENGNGFTLADGPFLELCRAAEKDLDKKCYVFIIDEINRGNLSKIFGELLMLIESDKRNPDYAVHLTYTKKDEDPFYVPSNVYLIGMMNTADRSLAMIDYALRRRFSFFTIEPAFENVISEGKVNLGDNDYDLLSRIISKIKELNKEITNDKSLGAGFSIGHSFFCPPPSVIDKKEDVCDWLIRVIKYEIYPLLEEYWFAEMNKPDEDNKVKSTINNMLKELGVDKDLV